MLETYFSAPKTLRRLRSGISGPHIDGFADGLERNGYAPSSAVRYIRAAAHLGCFVQWRGRVRTSISTRSMPFLAIFAVANALISSEQRSVITHVLDRSFSINAWWIAGSARVNPFGTYPPI